jgi:hypothetical protein
VSTTADGAVQELLAALARHGIKPEDLPQLQVVVDEGSGVERIVLGQVSVSVAERLLRGQGAQGWRSGRAERAGLGAGGW